MKRDYKAYAAASYTIGLIIWFGNFGALNYSISRLLGFLSIALLVFVVPLCVCAFFEFNFKKFSVLLKIGILMHIIGISIFLATWFKLIGQSGEYGALGPLIFAEALVGVAVTLMVVTAIAKKID